MAQRALRPNGACHTDRTDSAANAIAASSLLEEGGSVIEFKVDRMREAPFSLLRGSVVFSVDASVAHGGQGEVFRVAAVSNEVPIPCALKVFGSREDAQAEWDMLVAHEDDSTVPSPYAVGLVETTDALRWALLMEFVDGINLADVLDARSGVGMTIEDALRILAPIVRFAANCCHSRRADVHRDIKPSNIVVDERGKTRLLDFGIASNARSARRACGTEFFAAPELRFSECEEGSPDDARVDTYGIAATLYAMTIGAGRAPEYRKERTCLPSSFEHDGAVRSSLASKTASMIEKRFSMKAHACIVERACDAAFNHVDERIENALLRALAFCQADRPSPADLERMLPLDAQEREYRLLSEAVQEYLRLDFKGEGSPEGAIADESGRGFIEAIDAFNAGRYRESVPILRAHAARGNATATYYLGVCMRDGLGVDKRDFQQAAWLFSEAAEAGNMLAQNAFGLMLAEGVGIARNEELGVHWIRAAARDDREAGRCGFEPAKTWLREHGMDSFSS